MLYRSAVLMIIKSLSVILFNAISLLENITFYLVAKCLIGRINKVIELRFNC